MSNILVIDDKMGNFEEIAKILKDMEVNFLYAPRADYGVAMAILHKPLMIFINVHTHEFDLCDTIKKMKEDHIIKEVPIVGIVDEGNEAEIEKAYQCGISDILYKPFNFSEIYFKTKRRIENMKRIDLLKGYAFTDQLTGLPNKNFIIQRIDEEILKAKTHGDSCFSVMFLDFDGFKSINDTLGHTVGDIFIMKMADRLRGCLRPYDKVARFGGDEFLLLMDEIYEKDELSIIAERICKKVKEPFDFGEYEIKTSVSIGIEVVNNDFFAKYKSTKLPLVELIVKNADIAMYDAKNKGKDTFSLYHDSMLEAHELNNSVVKKKH